MAPTFNSCTFSICLIMTVLLERGLLPLVLLEVILRGAISLQRALTKTQVEILYMMVRVNPIVKFPNTGVAIYGQKTLQSAASATDRVNVRRLLLNLKNFIGTVAQGLVFEPNTLATRNCVLICSCSLLGISTAKTRIIRL